MVAIFQISALTGIRFVLACLMLVLLLINLAADLQKVIFGVTKKREDLQGYVWLFIVPILIGIFFFWLISLSVPTTNGGKVLYWLCVPFGVVCTFSTNVLFAFAKIYG